MTGTIILVHVLLYWKYHSSVQQCAIGKTMPVFRFLTVHYHESVMQTAVIARAARARITTTGQQYDPT